MLEALTELTVLTGEDTTANKGDGSDLFLLGVDIFTLLVGETREREREREGELEGIQQNGCGNLVTYTSL